MLTGNEKIGLLGELCEEYRNCTNCDLYKLANNKVMGAGNVNSPIMFIGISPGADEDKEGVPFVGKSGKKLDSVLYTLELKRESFYFTNLTLCRSADRIGKEELQNRDPTKPEFQACFTRLMKEIYIIDPVLIVTLGRTPTKYLTRKTTEISKLRGRILDINIKGKETTITYPVLPTWHPSYLLRNPSTLEKDPLHQFSTDIQRAWIYVTKYRKFVKG